MFFLFYHFNSFNKKFNVSSLPISQPKRSEYIPSEMNHPFFCTSARMRNLPENRSNAEKQKEEVIQENKELFK